MCNNSNTPAPADSISTPNVAVVTKHWGTYEDRGSAIAVAYVGALAMEQAIKYVQINGEEEARKDGMWDAFEKMMESWSRETEHPFDAPAAEQEAWHKARDARAIELAKMMGLDLRDRCRDHERIYYKIETGYPVNPDPYHLAK